MHSQHEQLFIAYDLPLDLRESALSTSLRGAGPPPPPPPTRFLVAVAEEATRHVR